MINSLCDKEMNERARLMSEAYDKGFKAGRNGVWISVKDELPDFGERVIERTVCLWEKRILKLTENGQDTTEKTLEKYSEI